VLRMKQAGWYEAIAPWRLFDMRLTANFYDIMFVVAQLR